VAIPRVRVPGSGPGRRRQHTETRASAWKKTAADDVNPRYLHSERYFRPLLLLLL
jgi:hypothetical protein